MKKTKISLIIPCYNEENNVIPFFEIAQRDLNQKDREFELIYINDGSKDNTITSLKKLINKKTNFNIKVIDFSRNFGKESAMYAGLCNATGDYIAIIDADLQQPPMLLNRMMDILDRDTQYDVVCYYQNQRIEGKLISKLKMLFYKIIDKMSGITFKNGASDFRMMRKNVVDAILSMMEYNRFSKGIFSWIGFETFYLPYTPEERASGQSSFNFKKLLKYAVNGILSFSTVPLKLATYSGIISSLLAFIYLIIIIIKKIFYTIDVPGFATIVVLILFIGGLILVSLGVIGEYIARIYIETKKRPIYIAKKMYDNEDNKGK